MKTQKRPKLKMDQCQEVQVHYKRPLFDSLRNISSSEDAEDILRDFADAHRIDHKEFFWAVLLTNANQVLGMSEIGVGCASGVTICTKEICQLALLTNASAVLIAHNHPSGKTNPSQADRQITKALQKVLDILDITLLDHIILTSEGYTSFKDNHWM